MIVSHTYKFIFFKTRKTAGTSIEIALSRFCGEQDTITPITPEDEELRQELGIRGPQNCDIPFGKYTLRNWGRYVMRQKRARFYNHMPARRARSLVGSGIWDTYYKFCFERNAWDKAISLYYWRTRDKKPRPSLLEFLHSTDSKPLSNFAIYTINGKLAADYVGAYENLDAELNKIRRVLSLPDKIQLPQAKSSFRDDRRDYTAIMGEEEESIVAKACEREIALFGYTF